MITEFERHGYGTERLLRRKGNRLRHSCRWHCRPGHRPRHQIELQRAGTTLKIGFGLPALREQASIDGRLTFVPRHASHHIVA